MNGFVNKLCMLISLHLLSLFSGLVVFKEQSPTAYESQLQNQQLLKGICTQWWWRLDPGVSRSERTTRWMISEKAPVSCWILKEKTWCLLQQLFHVHSSGMVHKDGTVTGKVYDTQQYLPTSRKSKEGHDIEGKGRRHFSLWNNWDRGEEAGHVWKAITEQPRESIFDICYRECSKLGA